MRLTYPKIETPITPKPKGIIGYKIFETFYHTILPITFTYIMVKYQQPLFILPILFIVIIRLKGE